MRPIDLYLNLNLDLLLFHLLVLDPLHPIAPVTGPFPHNPPPSALTSSRLDNFLLPLLSLLTPARVAHAANKVLFKLLINEPISTGRHTC